MYSGIHQANGVDILGADGLVRCGRVIELTDDGFFVDLRCPAGRRRFFPFDSNVFLTMTISHLFGMHTAEMYTTQRETFPVEMLMRETLSSPWKWIPAEMINLARGKGHEWYEVAVVKWGDHLARTDIVPVDRIRLRIPETWWSNHQHQGENDSYPLMGSIPGVAKRVGKGSFVMSKIKWEKDCPISAQELQRTLQTNPEYFKKFNEREIVFLEIKDGFLWYLERRVKAFMVQDREETPAQEAEAVPRMAPTYLPDLMKNSSPPPADLDILDGSRVLPMELWLEVFSHLDTLTQNKLRRVCSAWDALLQSPLLTANVVTGFSAMSDIERRDYNVTSPVFKCLRPSTRRILLVSRPKDGIRMAEFYKVMDMIRCVRENSPGVLTVTFYLVRYEWHFRLVDLTMNDRLPWCDCTLHHPQVEVDQEPDGDQCGNALDDFIATCRRLPCAAIQLSQCRFGLTVDGTLSCLAINIRGARLTVDDEFASTVREAFEASLPIPSEKQLHDLMTSLDRIADPHKCEDPKFRRKYERTVCKLLCATQTADPRSSLHYRGRKWCVDGLGRLQVEKLSRITLHFLIQLAKNVDDFIANHPFLCCQE